MKKFKFLALILTVFVLMGAFTACDLDDDPISDSAAEAPVLTIGYEEGRGTVELDGEEVSPGETFRLKEGTEVNLEAISQDGYIFQNWDGVENGEEASYLENYKVTEDTEVIANFPEAGTVSGYVTDNRGGPGIEGAKVASLYNETETAEDGSFSLEVKADNVFDMQVEKENRGMIRVQDVKVGAGEAEEFELPSRETFNPGWSDTSPRVDVSGVERGDVVSGDLEIEFEIDGDRSTYFYFVNFGGLQRGPRESSAIETDEGEAVIDTTKHPDGPSYIRVLAYDDNDNAVVKFIPVVVDNDQPGEEDTPPEPKWLGLTSITYGQNFGYYSERMEEMQEVQSEEDIASDLDREIGPETYETPEGREIDISSIPDESTLFVELQWDKVPEADGYSVYRSFDGEDFEHIGNVTEHEDIGEEEEYLVGFYNDFSPRLGVDKETQYKVIPYNEHGEGDALTREITPLAPYNVAPIAPEHEADDVGLTPTFIWEHNVEGEWPEDVMVMELITAFDATDFIEVEEESIVPGELAVSPDPAGLELEDPLEPNTVYSWDIYMSDAFLYEEDEDGFAEAVSIAGDGAGSLIGEFMFTTKSDVEEDSTPDELEEILSYEDVYSDADQETALVKSSDLNGLDSQLADIDSSVEQKWEPIDWAQVTVPANMDLPEFLAEVEAKEDVLMAQPNLPQDMPYHEEISEDRIRDQESFTADEATSVNIGAEDYEERLWGMENVNAEEAWDTTTGSDDVVVAIVDTGVDMTHPEFASNEFVAPLNATGDEWEGGALDIQGHGTHVAGTAVADGRTGNIAGASWDNPIMPIRVMDTEGAIESTYTIEGIMHIVEYMEANDARVVANYSIGGRGYDAAMKDALDYALDKGLIWVTSSGNDGKRVPNLPASYNGLISVAASTPQDVKTDFSTSGFWNSVAAPGEKIWSTYPSYFEDEDLYTYMQGTSMSSPHVTGAAALLLSENPDLSAVEVLNQVEQTARGFDFSEELGHGILDAEALLEDIQPVNYGSLLVNTDREGAKMTVFDSQDNLVGFAAVGPELSRKIHALEEGSYTVKLTHIESDNDNADSTNNTNTSETITEDVTISAEAVEEIDLKFD